MLSRPPARLSASRGQQESGQRREQGDRAAARRARSAMPWRRDACASQRPDEPGRRLPRKGTAVDSQAQRSERGRARRRQRSWQSASSSVAEASCGSWAVHPLPGERGAERKAGDEEGERPKIPAADARSSHRPEKMPASVGTTMSQPSEPIIARFCAIGRSPSRSQRPRRSRRVFDRISELLGTSAPASLPKPSASARPGRPGRPARVRGEENGRSADRGEMEPLRAVRATCASARPRR